MAYINQTGNYVKFLRGTPAAWDSITTKDPDTLYFVAETGATKGTLYLGSKLISGGVGSSVTNIEDLADVLISNNLPSNAVLVYNDTDQLWEPMALESALATIVGPMSGATAQNDGEAGLVPQPLAGEQGLFLRGDGLWANPTAQLTQQMNNRFDDLYAGDTGSIRDIASSLIDDLVGNAPASLDTLEELAGWVAEHESVLDITQAAVDIDNLTNAMFGTISNPSESNADLVQMVQTDGVVRILTNLNTIILGDAQTIGLQSKVNSLTNRIGDAEGAIDELNASMTTVQSRMTTIEANLTTVSNRLRWVDVVRDNG